MAHGIPFSTGGRKLGHVILLPLTLEERLLKEPQLKAIYSLARIIPLAKG